MIFVHYKKRLYDLTEEFEFKYIVKEIN